MSNYFLQVTLMMQGETNDAELIEEKEHRIAKKAAKVTAEYEARGLFNVDEGVWARAGLHEISERERFARNLLRHLEQKSGVRDLKREAPPALFEDDDERIICVKELNLLRRKSKLLVLIIDACEELRELRKEYLDVEYYTKTNMYHTLKTQSAAAKGKGGHADDDHGGRNAFDNGPLKTTKTLNATNDPVAELVWNLGHASVKVFAGLPLMPSEELWMDMKRSKHLLDKVEFQDLPYARQIEEVVNFFRTTKHRMLSQVSQLVGEDGTKHRTWGEFLPDSQASGDVASIMLRR